MKFNYLFFIFLLTTVYYGYAMEPEQQFSLIKLPKEILCKIMAHSKLKDQESLHYTDKALSAICIKDLIGYSPLVMSRKNHIRYLVESAKMHSPEKNREAIIKNLIRNAHTCDHEDVLDRVGVNVFPKIVDSYMFKYPELRCDVSKVNLQSCINRGDRQKMRNFIQEYPLCEKLIFEMREEFHSNVDTLFDQIVALYTSQKEFMDEYICTVYGCTFDDITQLKFNPLLAATSDDNVAMVEILLAQSHDLVNKEDLMGQTPLVRTSNLEIAEMLLSCKCIDLEKRVSYGDAEGKTILWKVAEEGNIGMLQCLLKHGADVNTTTIGITVLEVATMQGHDEAMQLLLQYGARARNARGGTEITSIEIVYEDDEGEEDEDMSLLW